jgi:hypothetical protein
MVDIYRVFHPTTRQCTFFSANHGTFSKIDHILGHKASLNNNKEIEITPLVHIKSQLNKTRPEQQRNHRKYSTT